MKTINNSSLNKKIILFRADLNVPVKGGKVIDNSRIESSKSSIKKLLNSKNKIFILAHFGRPKGRINKTYSLKFICPLLEKEFQVNKVHFLETLDDLAISNKIKEMEFGEICLIENIRFYSEEEKNNYNFAKEISKHFNVFVNDAFSASHRSHASIIGFTNFLPAIAGDSLIEEVKQINNFLSNPKKPNLAIIGGSKVSTKIDLLNNLVELFDTIIIGGAMANTFLYANNIEVGMSLFEKNFNENIKKILLKAKNFNCKIILPVDVVCSKEITDKINVRHCSINNVLNDQMILDIGENTVQIIKKEILKCKMLLWNGPLGAFEHKPFEMSSVEVANIINKYSVELEISSIAGGGDTISLIKLAKAEKGFEYISKAGGAFLEWLEGKESPGIKALKENKVN